MDGGDFSVCCNNSANGTGVNFILTSHTGTNYATIGYNQIYSGGNLNISAPTTGPYAGVAIYEDRNAPVGTAAFTGVAQITGSIYAPTANVGVLGNFNGCTSQIIAWAVYWNSSNHTSCTDTTVITSPSNNTISSVE
jgi:hypothetical protein